MFGWFKSRRAENEGLQAELLELKAAAAPLVASGGGGFGAPWNLSQPNLGQHREQLAAFSGYQYTAISAIAKRIAERELFVANALTTPAGPGGPRTLKASGGKRLRRKTMADGLEPLPTHPLIELLDDPNPVMVRWTLLFVTVAALELTGKAFWWMRATPDGLQLWPMPPHWMTPIHASGELFAAWKVRPDTAGESFMLRGDEVAYFYLPDPANPTGAISPLQSQAKSINIDEMLQQSQAADFRNGVKPSVILKAGRIKDATGRPVDARHILTPEQRQQLINAIQQAYGGYTKNGCAAIVDGLIEDIIPFSNRSPSEMSYLDSGGQVRSRIMSAYGVNPLIVGEIEGANRAQAVVAEQSFCQNVCNPLLTLMSQTITAWVCPLFAGDTGKLVAWFDPCRADDDELTFKQWSLAMNKGACTVNEYRVEVLGLPPIDGGDELPESGGAGAITPAAAELAKRLNPFTMRPIGERLASIDDQLAAPADPETDDLATLRKREAELQHQLMWMEGRRYQNQKRDDPLPEKRLALPAGLWLKDGNGNGRH